ncbi:hypothetical protein D3C87_1033130 [compost metagenome]
MPQRHLSRQEQRDQHHHTYGADGVRADHQGSSAVPVGQGAPKGAKYRLRQEGGHTGGRQSRHATRGVGDPPEQHELRQGGADQGEALTAKDGPETRLPPWPGVQAIRKVGV